MRDILDILDRSKAGEKLSILCLGAHSDDIEIGCGATIAKLIKSLPALGVTWVVFSAIEKRSSEAQSSAEAMLSSVKKKDIHLKNLRDGYFPNDWAQIKDVFEELKNSINPDLIFTHFRDDLHQDHRVVCDLTWNTFRNHLILEYEILKYDGDLGKPNCFVSIDEAGVNSKLSHIRTHFASQLNKHWLTDDALRGLMRIRGVECNSPSKFAEAFYCRKISLL